MFKEHIFPFKNQQSIDGTDMFTPIPFTEELSSHDSIMMKVSRNVPTGPATNVDHPIVTVDDDTPMNDVIAPIPKTATSPVLSMLLIMNIYAQRRYLFLLVMKFQHILLLTILRCPLDPLEL